MADAWKAGEKKGMLSTSNRVTSPHDEKKREKTAGEEGGGAGISRWWVIGSGEQGFVPAAAS